MGKTRLETQPISIGGTEEFMIKSRTTEGDGRSKPAYRWLFSDFPTQ